MIRSANKQDASEIWQIRTAAIQQSCSGHYESNLISLWAGSPMPPVFAEILMALNAIVLIEQQKIVAFGFADDDAGIIESLFVCPQHKGKGFGKQVLAELENQMINAGTTEFTLSSTLNAVEFYRSAGYRADSPTSYQHPDGFELPCVPMYKRVIV